MPVNIRGRHFLKLIDYTPAEIRYLLDLSHNFKDLKRAGTPHRYLEGKNVVLLFEKTSTRTRCAFEVAGRDLGMGVTYLDPGSSQMGKKESIADTAKVLGRMYDGIEYRGFSQKIVEELAANAGVPVWNGLTDEFHPTQMLADLLTIEEKKGTLKGLKFTYFGDARNNMGNSLMIAYFDCHAGSLRSKCRFLSRSRKWRYLERQLQYLAIRKSCRHDQKRIWNGSHFLLWFQTYYDLCT